MKMPWTLWREWRRSREVVTMTFEEATAELVSRGFSLRQEISGEGWPLTTTRHDLDAFLDEAVRKSRQSADANHTEFTGKKVVR